MAIQLNERDHLIFRYIEEHQVLLEKHIAWFISVDAKPVLIRDRLRKLFYLDYLLCQRHKNTLPWWTTPTKPLVYLLSPMTKEIINAKETELDLLDPDVQRHLLEVANLRMLFLMDGSEGLISDFDWQTGRTHGGGVQYVDAKVSFVRHGVTHRIGIINHPTFGPQAVTGDSAGNKAFELVLRIESALAGEEIEILWVVSRDEDHQENLQKHLLDAVGNNQALSNRLVFATHQELYKSGVIKTRWQTVEQRLTCIFVESLQEHESRSCTQARFQAASA